MLLRWGRVAWKHKLNYNNNNDNDNNNNEGSCEHGNEPSGSIKCWEVLE
jgi:hypothetical protein